MKKCNKCGENKPLDEFYRHNKAPDGRTYTCKACMAAYARQWNKDHPGRVNERARLYQQTEQGKATRKAYVERTRSERLATSRGWYANNRERINAKQRARLANDPEFRERSNKRSREWMAANRTRRGHYQRSALYGLTQEQFDALLIGQLGCCAICEEQADLLVDHDHAATYVRGLLCARCNHGLGHFRDNPDYLVSAAAYLRRTRE